MICGIHSNLFHHFLDMHDTFHRSITPSTSYTRLRSICIVQPEHLKTIERLLYLNGVAQATVNGVTGHTGPRDQDPLVHKLQLTNVSVRVLLEVQIEHTVAAQHVHACA